MWFVGGNTVCVITCVGQCYTRWSVDLRYDELLGTCRFLVLQSADSWEVSFWCLTVGNVGCRPTRLNSTRRPLSSLVTILSHSCFWG